MNYMQKQMRKAERRRKETALAKRKKLEKAAPDLLAELELFVKLLCHPGSYVTAKDIEKAKDIIAEAKGN